MSDRVITDSREAQAVIEQLIQEMRATSDEHVLRSDRVSTEVLRAFADRLALLADVLGSQTPVKEEEGGDLATRVDEQTVIPPERATASGNEAIRAVWEPIRDFDGEVYQPTDSDARIAALRQAVRNDPVFAAHSIPSGRAWAEVECENYRVLLRRIDELEADITELLTPDNALTASAEVVSPPAKAITNDLHECEHGLFLKRTTCPACATAPGDSDQASNPSNQNAAESLFTRVAPSGGDSGQDMTICPDQYNAVLALYRRLAYASKWNRFKHWLGIHPCPVCQQWRAWGGELCASCRRALWPSAEVVSPQPEKESDARGSSRSGDRTADVVLPGVAAVRLAEVVSQPQEGWQPIETAPKNASWVLVLLKDGDIRRAHWASDLSGSDQPAFQGWFIACGSRFVELESTPTHWAHIPASGEGSIPSPTPSGTPTP